MKKECDNMRLRRGFGTVRKLTGNRRNGYAVHPPKVNGIQPLVEEMKTVA